MTDSANSSPYQAWTGDGEQLSASPLLFEYRSGTIQQDELPLTGIAEIGATAADATALEALSDAVGRKRVGQLSYREVASRLQPCSRQVAVASDGSVAYLLHTRLLSTLSQSTDGTMSLKETFYGEISRENSEVRGTESVHEGDLSPQFSCHLDSSLTERPELRKLCWSKECRHILVLGELCQQIFIYSKDCRLLALISVPLIRGLRAAFDLDQNWELRCVDILPNTGCSSDNHELESQRAVTFFCVFNDVFVQAVTIPEKNLSGDSSHPKTLQLLDIHTQVVYSQQNSRQRTPIPLLTDRSVEAIHWFTEELQDKSAVQWVVIIAVDAAKKVLAGGDQFAFLTMFRCHGAVTDAVVWEEFFTATVERKKLPTTMSNSLEASNAYRQNSMLGVVGAAAVSRFGSMLGLNLGGPGSGQSSGKYFAPIIQICTSPDNRLMMILHGDGSINAISLREKASLKGLKVCLRDNDSFHPTFLQRPEERTLSEEDSSVTITTRLYFLSTTLLSAVSRGGATALFVIDSNKLANSVSKTSPICSISGGFPRAVVESLPPKMGPCACTAYAGSDTSQFLLLLRMNDAWSCQIFRMIVTPPEKAIHTMLNSKCCRKTLDRALALAEKSKLRADLVYKEAAMEILNTISLDSVSHTYQNHSENEIPYGLKDLPFILENIDDDLFVVQFLAIVPGCLRFLGIDFDLLMELTILDDLLREALRRADAISHPTQDYRQSAKVLECVAKCRSILMQKLEVLSALTLVLHQSACESESVWYFSANRAHNTNDWISGGEWSLLEGSSSTLIDGAELLDLQNTDPMNLNTTRIRDRQSKSSVKDLEKRLLMFLLDNVQLFKSSDKNLASTALSQDIFSISLDDIVQFCARAGLINLLDCLVERWPRFKLNLLELVDSIPLFISPKVYLPLIYKTLQLLEDNTLDNAVGSQEVYNDGSLVPEEEDFYFTRQTANRLAENSVVIQELVKHTVLSCIAASASKHSPTDMLSCWDKVQFLKYIARHAMKLEFYGQSMFAYHVAEFAIVNYRKCSGEGKDADEIAEALRQWSLEIRVFCNFLYSDTIPKANSFTDWLAMSTLKKLEVVVEYSLATQQNLAYVINHLIRPAMDTLDRTTTTSWLPTLIKLISGSTYASRLQLVLHKLHRLDLTMKDTLDESLTSILVQLLKPMEYQCLSAVLLVVQASVPTLPLNERCIQSTSSLMRLVVNSSFAYDDIDSGMALMWQMIECTPSRQATIDNSAPESALATTKQLLVRLDALEAALTAAELIKLYIAVPPLSILIETEAFQASTNLSNVEHSIHKWRLTKRQYTQQLLRGIAFLANQLLPSQLIKNTADGSDRSTDETDILDSSAEFTPDHLSLGEALFLRIIHDFYLLWSRVSNNSTIAREKSGVLSAGWSGLANNLIDLRNNYFNRISLVWIGRALLQCLIHYNVDNIYVPAALCLVGKKADSEEKLYQNLENDVASLGFTLSTMGVTAQCAWATLLEKSKEFFNAVSSRDEADYAQALRLLEIVQSNFSNDSVDSTQFQKLCVDTEAESRLHQLLKFLSSIEMDFIPVQLRLLQPLTVMQKILEERPEAYYCILGTNDEMDSSSTPSFERNTDNFFIRRRQILDNLFPSSLSRFLDTLFGLSSNKSSDESEALLLLMQVGLKLGDLVGCFKLCKLAMKPEWYGSASTSTQQEISSMVSVLIGLLSGDDGFDLSEKLIHTFLMNDLQASLMVCTGEMGSKGSFQSPTWQQEESTDFNLMKSSENVASQGLELLYMAINSTLSIEESDPENLIRAIAVKVIMEEALGYFLLSVDTDFSLQGVEKLVSDLERKYTQLKVRIIRQDSTGNSPLPSVGIDESLIQALIKKGFTRNGAKRSVYMVSRQSAESPRTRAGTSTLLSQSIAYAIDHCGDPDFDHPVVEAVSGALRGKVANKLSNSEDVDLEIQYRKVHELLVLFRELKFCLQTALGLPHIATQPLTVEDPVLSDGSIPSTPNLIGLPSNLPSTQNNSSPSTTIETSRSIRKPREKTVREKPKATKKTLGARKITDEIDERNTTDSSLVGQITERMVDIANESAFAPGLLEGKEYTTEPLPQIAVEGFAETLDSLQQSMDLPEIPKLAIISSNVIGKVEVELSTDKTRANADRIGKQPETKLDETFGELVDLSNQKSVADINVQKPIVEFDNSSRSDQPFVEADREIAVDILEDLIAGEVSEEISEPHELYLRQLTGLLEVGASYVGFDAENIESIVVAFGHENREMELQRNQSRRFEVSADLCSNSGSSTVYNLLCALAICREESAEELLLQLLRIIVNSFLPFAQSFEKSLIKELHRNHPGKLDVRRVVSEQASALEVLNFWTCILRLQNRLFFTGDTVIPTINTSEKNLRVDLNSTAIADRLISDLISIDPRGFFMELAHMYLAVDNQDLYGIEYIKLAAATAVKACDGQEEQLLTMIATDRALFVGIDVATPTKAIDVKQLLKSLQDDVTYLKRISRIEEREGINCKLAIKSEGLLAVGVLAEISTGCLTSWRTQFLSQLVPKLSGSSLASWLRGFGRLWDVGPSELHFYYLHHHLKKYLINSLNLQQTQLSENHMNTAIELNFYRPIASHDSENWKMLLDLLRSFTQKLREQHQILLCLEFMGLMAATNNTAAPASVLYLKLHLLDLRVEGECHLTTVLHAEEVCEALTAFIEANPAQSESSRRRITRGDEKQDSSVSPLSVAIEEGKQFVRGLQLVPLHLHLQIISGKFGDIQYCADYLMEEILPSLQHSSEQKKSMVDGILFSHHALFRLVHSLVDSSETLDSVAVDSWTTILIDYSLGVLTRSEIWKMLLVGAAKKSEIKSSQTRTPESNFRRLTGLYILGKEVLCIPSLVVLSQKILNLILKVRYVSKKENVSLLVDSKQSIVPRAEELAHFLSTDYSSDLLYGNQVSEEVVPYLSAILCCNHIIGDLSVSERYFSAFAENESSLNSLLQQYQLMVKVLEARVVLLDTCCALSRDMQEMIIEFLQNQNSNVFCPFYDSESSDNFHAISFVGKELTLALSNLLTDLILMMTNFIDLYPEKVTLAVQKITNLCRIWSLKSSMSVEKLLCRNCDFLIFAAIDMYDVSDEPIERSLICLSVFEPLLELLLLLQLKGYPANLLDFAINELSMLRRHSREESGMAASIKGDILRCFSQLEGIWKASPASSLTTIETAEVTIIWSLLAGNAVVDSEFSSSHFGVYIEQEIQKECTTNAGLASSSGLSELRLPCSLWVLAMLADILHGRVDCGESASAVQSSAFAVAIGGAMDSWNSRLSSAPLGTCESSDKLSSGKIDHTRLTQVDWNVDLRDRHKMLDSATSSSLPILLSPIVAFAALLALQRFREAATVYWLLVGYPSSAFSVSNALHRLKSDLSQISDERSDRIGENSIGSDANKEDLDDKILNREGFQSKDTLMIVRIVAAVSGKEQSEFCVQLLARVLKSVSVKQN